MSVIYITSYFLTSINPIFTLFFLDKELNAQDIIMLSKFQIAILLCIKNIYIYIYIYSTLNQSIYKFLCILSFSLSLSLALSLSLFILVHDVSRTLCNTRSQAASRSQ